ncbi:MAG: hypothetical protein JW875_08335 [Spirochaetales bacterium]|nr:hypothetical protein [Spirochaetales bacterium]
MDYEIDTTTESLHSTGGFALVGKIFERIGFGQNYNDQNTLQHPEILKVLGDLFVQGRSRFEEASLFQYDSFFHDSLNLKYIPARETIRLYLEKMANEKQQVRQAIGQANMKLMKRTSFTTIDFPHVKYLPVDIDTSPLDNSKSNKEGVSWTYKTVAGSASLLFHLDSGNDSKDTLEELSENGQFLLIKRNLRKEFFVMHEVSI